MRGLLFIQFLIFFSGFLISAEKDIKKSLYKNSKQLKLTKWVVLFLNVVFFIYFLGTEKKNLFYTSKLVHEKESRILLFILSNKLSNFIQTLPFLNSQISMFTPNNYINETIEHFVVNFCYFAALIIFYTFIFNEKNFKFNRSTLFLHSTGLILSPFSLLALFDNHIENIAFIFFTLAFLMTFNSEFELAVVFFFISQAFFSPLAEYAFLTFFGLVFIRIYVQFKRSLQIYNLTIFGRQFLVLGIFAMINVLVGLELEASEFKNYKQQLLKMLTNSLKILPISLLSFMGFFAVSIQKNLPKENFYKNWVGVIFCLVIFFEKDGKWTFTYLFLTLLLNSFFLLNKKSMERQLLLVFPILASTFYFEKPAFFLFISIFLQLFNILFVLQRNSFSLKNNFELIKVVKNSKLEFFWKIFRILENFPTYFWVFILFVNFLISLLVFKSPKGTLIPYFLYHVLIYPAKKLAF